MAKNNHLGFLLSRGNTLSNFVDVFVNRLVWNDKIMRTILGFRFSTSTLTAYFVISAIGFIFLFIIIWTISIRADKIANMRHEVSLIMEGISGSILGTAELEAQGVQTQTIIQSYLEYTFDARKNEGQDRVTKVVVYRLNPDRQLVTAWDSGRVPPLDCLDERFEYVQPAKSRYPYLVEVAINVCATNKVTVLEYHSISLPVLLSFALILIWGACVFIMLQSVTDTEKILGETENADELMEKTEKIKWNDVRVLTQKAILIRGKNLQFFQTLILDAHHDVSKILENINRSHKDKDLTYNVSVIRGIMQKLAIDVSSSEKSEEAQGMKSEINSEYLGRIIQSYFVDCEIQNTLSDNLILPIKDISTFERIIVNLASNAIRHAKEFPLVKMYYEKNLFRLRIYSSVSLLNYISIFIAILTKRIDTQNQHTPVYVKLLGRTGRGLSIIKKGVFKLGGRMIFSIENKLIKTGIDLPAIIKHPQALEITKTASLKKKYIFFKSPVLQEKAREYGLGEFLIDEPELMNLKNEAIIDCKVEIVTDVELDLPESFTLKLITKEERIKGISLNWLGNDKI